MKKRGGRCGLGKVVAVLCGVVVCGGVCGVVCFCFCFLLLVVVVCLFVFGLCGFGWCLVCFCVLSVCVYLCMYVGVSSITFSLSQ